MHREISIMPRQSSTMIPALAALCLVVAAWRPTHAETVPASAIPAADLIQPADLAAQLRSDAAPKRLILQVGFRTLYEQAHIRGAEYAGAAGNGEGLRALRERVAKLPKDTAIVLYCGCCPWTHCPNIGTAYQALHALGFARLKVLYIADNFGSDWVDKGYPVANAS
jgi:thiosulfate/3-mercaptopyruvate sulfurtransferase